MLILLLALRAPCSPKTLDGMKVGPESPAAKAPPSEDAIKFRREIAVPDI